MPQTIFGTEVPDNLNNNDFPDQYTLGTRFRPFTGGRATHGEWHFPLTSPTEPVEMAIYRDSDEVLLGSATFPGGEAGVEGDPVASRHRVAFDPPIDLAAETDYIVALWTSDFYVSTSGYFGTDKTSGDLYCPTVAGRFNVGPTLTFPSGNFGNANYWPDFVFVPDGEEEPPHDTAGTAALTLGASVAVSTSRVSAGTAALTATATATRSTVRTTSGRAVLALSAYGVSVRGGGGPRLVTVSRGQRLTTTVRPGSITTSTRG